jgi:hypothetical protein
MGQKINRTIFFSLVRQNPFGGKLTQQNVDGTNAILDAWEGSPYSTKPIDGLAYILATAFGETGTMKWDVREGAPKGETRQSYFTRMYDIRGSRPHVAQQLGNVNPGDGAIFYGRGPSQITGRRNYTVFAGILGIPLVEQPDLALVKEHAMRILLEGMYRGTFTGRKLDNYFDGAAHDDAEMKRRRVAARAIINGKDKAEVFARVAAAFGMALVAARVEPSKLLDLTAFLPSNVVETTNNPAPLPDIPGLPPILRDMGAHVINAAITEATGGKVTLPVDKGKPLTQSAIIGGSLVAAVPGIISTIAGIEDKWVAGAICLLIAGGAFLVISGRIKIKDESGV